MPKSEPHKLLEKLRAFSPLVQCIQNSVAQDLSANALLSIGASPAMVSAVEESPDFMKKASALSVNMGSLTATRVEEIKVAVAAAKENGKPWCMDPVACGATPFRTKSCAAIMQEMPTVVRGNASEILALSAFCLGTTPYVGGRGVDSTAQSQEALYGAMALAKKYSCVVFVSGEDDLVTNGVRIYSVSNGVKELTKITALGCSLSAIVAAFLAVADGDYLEAAVAGAVIVGLCGEGLTGPSPATLRTHWLNRLYSISLEKVAAGARYKEIFILSPESLVARVTQDGGAAEQAKEQLESADRSLSDPAVKCVLSRAQEACEDAALQCLYHPLVALRLANSGYDTIFQEYENRAVAMLSKHATVQRTRSNVSKRFKDFLSGCEPSSGGYYLANTAATVMQARIGAVLAQCKIQSPLSSFMDKGLWFEKQAKEKLVDMSYEEAIAYYMASLRLQIACMDEAHTIPYDPTSYMKGVAIISKLTNTQPPKTTFGVPRVLIIAGSDCSGGAGIQADMKACDALGVYSMTAITALTAQNTLGVKDIHGAPPEFVTKQIECCLDDVGTDVIKTGMLATVEVVDAVVAAAGRPGLYTWVVDPVMVSTSGVTLVQPDAVDRIKQRLFPLAHIITPNIPEASLLLGREIKGVDAMKEAAKDLAALGPKWVLVKGGHFDVSELDEAVDVLYDSKKGVFHAFSSAIIDTKNSHGTGCTLASSIAAGLAQGMDCMGAVQRAKQYVWDALKSSADLHIGNGHGPLLHHFRVANQVVPSARQLCAPRSAAALFGGRKINLSVYVITDEECCKRNNRTVEESVMSAIFGGATVVQLRMKEASASVMVAMAKQLVAQCRPLGVPVIINDRVDVALASDADGVHVGQDDIPCAEVRKMIGPSKILGVSAKTPELAVMAQEAGADYVGSGAVWETGTKVTTSIGLAGLKAVVEHCGIPVVAIGGITVDNCAECITAGAVGVAVVSAVFGQSDVAAATQAIKKEVARCL